MKGNSFNTGALAATVAVLSGVVWLAVHSAVVRGEDTTKPVATNKTAPAAKPKKAPQAAPDKSPARNAPKLPEPKGAKRLSRVHDVWVDPVKKIVIVDGQISLREGMLEMFACVRNTKEHESIVSANTKAYLVHTALLLVGAEPGRPVQFVPKYRPPEGTEIEITCQWVDEKGKEHTARAQDWIKDIPTKKAMDHPFVFTGSSFWTDEQTGKKFYQAEGGDFICVSNFGTAMIDVPIKSSQSNAELEFEAFTERIPPLGAPVRLILKPKLKEAGKDGQRPPSERKTDEPKAAADAANNGDAPAVGPALNKDQTP